MESKTAAKSEMGNSGIAIKFVESENKYVFKADDNTFIRYIVSYYCNDISNECISCRENKISNFFQIMYNQLKNKYSLCLCINCFNNLLLGAESATLDDGYEEIRLYGNCMMKYTIDIDDNDCGMCNSRKKICKFVTWQNSRQRGVWKSDGHNYCIDCLLNFSNRKKIKYCVTASIDPDKNRTSLGRNYVLPLIWQPSTHKYLHRNLLPIVPTFLILYKLLKAKYNIKLDKHIAYKIFQILF